ncbi:MAG: membrane dipeptidase [Bacteroidetes bacterium]|nr:MAG: membrane dipeptidase [Bacteroidota bacterium]
MRPFPIFPLFPLLLTVLLLAGCRPEAASDPLTATEIQALTDDELRALADELAHKYILVDGHIDVPYRMTNHPEDIANATDGGDFDFPRARAGGLDAPFMSIYIPASYQETGGARAFADSLIDMVEGFAAAAPTKFAIATSPDDVRRQFEKGLISLPMGMENGAPIEDDLANVEHFFRRGIRYITLTHSENNQIGDSSYDTEPTWNGLSPFGEQVIDEMNRLGMMIDISHVTDSTAFDVLARSRAPVIASHSSCRHFTPGWERNMGDDLIRALADHDGVIMINFGSSFLRTEYQAAGNRIQQQIIGYLSRNGIDRDSPEGLAYFREQRRANPVGTVQDVVDHIEHVRQLVGVDHIGLGSDFDGVFALPDGLQDVSQYPNLIYALLKTGHYSEEDIAKILGGNVLRVWDQVVATAREMQEASSDE